VASCKSAEPIHPQPQLRDVNLLGRGHATRGDLKRADEFTTMFITWDPVNFILAGLGSFDADAKSIDASAFRAPLGFGLVLGLEF